MNMHEWTDFLVASSGASAALLGLLFVGLSINLKKIISIPHLPGRAFAAMLLLATMLVVSLCALVPRLNPMILAGVTFFPGALSWFSSMRGILASLKYLRVRSPKQRIPVYVFFLRFLIVQLSTLPYVVAGILLGMNNPFASYWLVPAFLFSVLAALYDTWVLLIEINR
jgi:modulator of FtsH protease